MLCGIIDAVFFQNHQLYGLTSSGPSKMEKAVINVEVLTPSQIQKRSVDIVTVCGPNGTAYIFRRDEGNHQYDYQTKCLTENCKLSKQC